MMTNRSPGPKAGTTSCSTCLLAFVHHHEPLQAAAQVARLFQPTSSSSHEISNHCNSSCELSCTWCCCSQRQPPHTARQDAAGV
jgi:hypothetical protein